MEDSSVHIDGDSGIPQKEVKMAATAEVDGKDLVFFGNSWIEKKPKETIISVPKDAKKLKIKFDGENYSLILEFDDSHNMQHFWYPKYDGYSQSKCCDTCIPSKNIPQREEHEAQKTN